MNKSRGAEEFLTLTFEIYNLDFQTANIKITPLLPYSFTRLLSYCSFASAFSSVKTALRESLILLPSLPMHLTITC